MRTSHVALYALAQAANVAAFPSFTETLVEAEIQKRQGAPDLTTTFDPKLQYVSNTGIHAFQAPNFEAGDVRGPCPGLNAMG